MKDRKEQLARLSNIEINESNSYYLHYLSYHRELKHAIISYAKGDLLDIGCGNKPYESLFKDLVAKYVGCDIMQSNLNKVDILSPANKIPCEDNGFDTIFSTQTIEHVEDPQGLICEAFRLLKPNGHFILAGPMNWPIHEEPYDFYRFTKYGFQYLLEAAGFDVIEIIPNGGMWATAGLNLIHALETAQATSLRIRIMISIYHRLKIRTFINRIFSWLDDKCFNDFNTINYVVIARKN